MLSKLRNNKPQHWAIVLLAALLFASPWFLGYREDVKPDWNAWVFAVALAYIAIASLFEERQWEDWLALIIGGWLIAAPWLLGYNTIPHALIAQASVGIVVVLVSGWAIWRAQHAPPHLIR
jgi:SPW repeat